MITAVRKLFLLQLVSGALLLWLGYEWLGMGESTRVRLLMSALAALGILALACWLHGAALVFFRQGGELKAAFRTALGHAPALVTAAIVVCALYGVLAWAASASGQPAFRLASWLTLRLRTPVKPALVARTFLAAFWMVRWVALPAALLPMASGIAARGWRGFGEMGWRGGWRYGLEVALLLVTGLLLPFVVLRWVPAVNGFTQEMVSFAARMLAAYLMFVGAIWTLERLTGRLAGPAREADPPTIGGAGRA